MIAEIGHFALALALLAALAQTVAPAIGARRGWDDFMALGDRAALVQLGLVAGSFVALTIAFVVTDFSVALVAQHSHSQKPLLYKISGVWGNHEGSMLLWALILALFGAAIAVFGRNLPATMKAWTLSTQGALGLVFIAFILFTSNPFERLPAPPIEGRDLNPVLQDPGLAFHPPFLYLGYVGLSTVFSFAVAALIEGRVDNAWARWVRPWTLAAWVFLTLGIALGSYWAYYELGWGGWWFWDPVENASFMPWLAAAALFHSAIVVEKRGELKNWTILLAIVAFGLSLLGTFLVRSGVIDSVHAFASDPTRGVFILAILFVTVGGALLLYAGRSGALGTFTGRLGDALWMLRPTDALRSDGLFEPISRESALLLNNVLLAVSTVAVLFGTLIPIVYEAFGLTITVGAPYYDWVFGALMVILMLALPIGAMLPWKRGDAVAVTKRLAFAGGATALTLAVIWVVYSGGAPMAPIGAALAMWVLAGAAVDLLAKARFRDVGFSVGLKRLAGLPRAEWGKFCGHAGVGLTCFGIAMSVALETEEIRRVEDGARFEVGGYEIVFRGVERSQGPNYVRDRATVEILSDGALTQTLTPERRFFESQRMWTSEVALAEGLTRDVYAVLGEFQEGSGWALRVYVKPFIVWIWLGALIMSIGGLLSLADRRCRVGAPAARRSRAREGGAVATPAE